MEKKVRVKGEAKVVWQNLLNTLAANGYEIETQFPYTQIRAKRGSKLSSFLMEGTRGGFRQLNITLLPQAGNEVEVQFRFVFPSWAITLPGTKKECSQMIDEFVRLSAEVREPEPSRAGGLICEKCGASNAIDASFCTGCGAKLESRAARVCPQCKTSLPAGSKFCPECGTKL